MPTFSTFTFRVAFSLVQAICTQQLMLLGICEFWPYFSDGGKTVSYARTLRHFERKECLRKTRVPRHGAYC